MAMQHRCGPLFWVVAFLSLTIGVSCGDSGSSGGGATGGDDGDGTTADSGLSLRTTVSVPVAADLASPVSRLKFRASKTAKAVGVHPHFLEEVASEATVSVTDLGGTPLLDSEGTAITATTDASGVCDLTGLTSAQLAAGVMVSAVVNGVEIQSYVQPTAEEITAAEAGTAIEEEVNSTTDMAVAVLGATCGEAGLPACGTTVDMPAVQEAIAAIVDSDGDGVSDDEITGDNLAGLAAAVYAAEQSAILNGGTGTAPADILGEALQEGGDASVLQAIVGTSIEDVAVADAVSEFKEMMTTMVEAYCTKDESDQSAWETVKAQVETNGETFAPTAVTGLFKELEPGEIANYTPEHFNGVMTAMPTFAGGMAAFSGSESARRAVIEQMRLGASFNDGTKAGMALGLVMATFPKGASGAIDFTADSTFDPEVAARAAQNTFLEFENQGDVTLLNPEEVFEKFHDTLSDSDYRRSFASGGTFTFGSFVEGFWDNRDNLDAFDPTQFDDMIRMPPGAVCESNSDCLPCDSCVSSVCTSLSTVMGLSCATNDDCDGITSCVGGFMSERGGSCLCATDVPMGAYVHADGEGPKVFGDSGEGGWSPPQGGEEGSACNSSLPCHNGMTCSSAGSGVCLGSDFKKGAFASCSANSECASESCTGGLCTMMSAAQMETFYDDRSGGGSGSSDGTAEVGIRVSGQPCSMPTECASFFCSDGLCSAPPEVFEGAVHDDDRRQNGESCTLSSECASFYCSAGTCQAPTVTDGAMGGGGGGGVFSTPTSLPVGSFCMGNAECASLDCNVAMHMCR